MHTEIGIGLIVSGTSLVLLLLFAGWRRLPARVALGLAGVLGATIGAGVLLLQDDSRAADWVVTLAGLAAFTPMHVRFVLGGPGRPA